MIERGNPRWDTWTGWAFNKDNPMGNANELTGQKYQAEDTTKQSVNTHIDIPFRAFMGERYNQANRTERCMKTPAWKFGATASARPPAATYRKKILVDG